MYHTFQSFRCYLGTLHASFDWLNRVRSTAVPRASGKMKLDNERPRPSGPLMSLLLTSAVELFGDWANKYGGEIPIPRKQAIR